MESKITKKRKNLSMTGEKRESLAMRLLMLLNSTAEKTGIIKDILFSIKEHTGFEAIGIRLNNGDDYPYYEVAGFPSDFVEAEKNLCMRDESGEVVRDPMGNPVLECVCGTVITGGTDPSKEFFSEYGSFWTNSTTELLPAVSAGDLGTLTRNRCHTEGYESVALIPLKSGDEIIGILQLNDSRKFMFSDELINFLEGIGSSIGIALKRQLIDFELSMTNEFLETILNNTHMLVAYMDAGFNFIKVNRAYAEKDEKDPSFFTGKNHFELYPDAENEKIFRRVVKTGKPFFVYAKPFLYPDNPERGVTYWDWSLIPIRDAGGSVSSLVFTLADVTKRIQMERELTEFREQLEGMVRERTLKLKDTDKKLKHEIAVRVKAEDDRGIAYAELNQIFNTILVGIAMIDSECKFIRVNSRFLEMFSLEEGEVFKKKCDELWNEPRCGTKNCPLQMILSGEKFAEFETVKKIGGGREIICVVNSVPYITKDGGIKGIIQYYIDVTEKREIEKEVLHVSEEERQRIGNDLHDIIGQNLTAIAFLVEAAGQKVGDRQYAGAMENIEQIDSLIRNAISQTRKITRMLRPVEMERRGLRAALDVMASATEELFNVSCKITQRGDFSIDDMQISTHLFYIAREAVNNAVKHARPGRVEINLISDESGLSMIIHDDGTGSRINQDDTGMGLKIMQYRANMIGAGFSAGNSDDGGFQVEVRLRK